MNDISAYEEEKIKCLRQIADNLDRLVDKFGIDNDNLNVTLFTDKPIEVKNK